jgi:hypothetical protein
MGYTTTFKGKFNTSRQLTDAEITYLIKFSKTRRMRRNPLIAQLMDDPARVAVGLPIGDEAQYFVGGGGFMGQNHDHSILDYNDYPQPQPSLWCHWIPTKDGNAIEWDEGEKFYDYIEWIQYIIDHFLKPWGIVLNGVVDWFGEERSDVGTITIQNNVLVNTLEDAPIEGEFQEIITDKTRLLN